MRSLCFCLSLLLSAVFASPAADPAQKHRQETPRQDAHASLAIALHPQDRTLLETTLLKVSDPTSQQYGQHLSRQEAISLLHPSPQSVSAVKAWLTTLETKINHVEGQWLHVSMPRAIANQVMKRQAAVPSSVRKYISIITRSQADTALSSASSSPVLPRCETGQQPAKGKPFHDKPSLKACAEVMTPACLQYLYKVDSNFTQPAPRSLLGVVGFDKQAAQHEDLSQFLHELAPYAQGSDFSTRLANGGTNPQSNKVPSDEVNFDVEYAIAMGYPVPVRFYSVGGDDHDFVPDLDLNDTTTGAIEPLLPFCRYLLDLPDSQLPQVVTMSFGVNEQLVPRSHANQICNMFGQLGARGVSILAGTGDYGPGASCIANGNPVETGTQRFLPSWPASCPYVTAVGATQLVNQSHSPPKRHGDSGDLSQLGAKHRPQLWEEEAVFFSGGGFSDFFSRPVWQEDAVTSYLQKLGNTTWDGLYNPQGRAMPDIAVNGGPAAYYSKGALVTNFIGTSASAPIFAGMVARLNDERIKSGRSPLGFLNPWIYHHGSAAFTDIRTGGSTGCLGSGVFGNPTPSIPDASWNATTGWDPATGMGTPDFEKLRKVIQT